MYLGYGCHITRSPRPINPNPHFDIGGKGHGGLPAMRHNSAAPKPPNVILEYSGEDPSRKLATAKLVCGLQEGAVFCSVAIVLTG